jgi:hypothetical protein
MQVIFLLPLGLSIGGTIFILVNSDFGWKAKTFAVLLTGASIVCLFLPGVVHFAVPLAMQLVICFWLVFYFQMQR